MNICWKSFKFAFTFALLSIFPCEHHGRYVHEHHCIIHILVMFVSLYARLSTTGTIYQINQQTEKNKLKRKLLAGRDSSVGKSSSQAGDPGSNSSWLGSTNAWMRGEEITSCKSHIASVSLTDWCIMFFVGVFFL